MNIKQLLADVFTQAFHGCFQGQMDGDFKAEITQSTQAQFGHYQCNSALKLAKPLKLAPPKIAQAVIAYINNQPDLVAKLSKLELAGPGFINVTLSTEFITQSCEKMRKDAKLGVVSVDPKRVVLDFSSPNIAKEMHVGHLRSTIIGDSLARVLAFLGHDVLRINHVGDWGTAFGMLIAYIKSEAPELLTNPDSAELGLLVQYYRQAKAKFDAEPEFKKQSQLSVVALQGGDPEAIQIWKLICEISRKSYQEIYDILDIHLIERGESFYNPYLKETIDSLEKQGLIEISEGAKCLFLEGYTNREGEPLPFMLQKSDGGFNYAATDMAAIQHRLHTEKGHWLIYVTDIGQATHFAMLFKAAEKAGWYNPAQTRIDHVPFGLVLGPDGKKFKTRSGDTERLIDLIHTAIQKAQEILTQKRPDLSDADVTEIAHVLGINAIKYADLSSHRIHDYQFSYDRMLQFEGNTAAFLMYAYVRIHGIKRELERKGGDTTPVANTSIGLQHESEIQLGLHLAQFHESLDSFAEDLLPHRLCEYLYILADKYNAFFRDCRVIGSPEQNARLALCDLAAAVLKQGMTLLGLRTVEQM